MIRKVLLPNRGEIAVQVLRSLHEAGLQGIAVCSDANSDNLHVPLASASYAIGPAPTAEGYLRFDRIRHVTRRSAAGAIHLGYGKPRVRGSMRADLVGFLVAEEGSPLMPSQEPAALTRAPLAAAAPMGGRSLACAFCNAA
ncbi:biotin carboxylase N-terminal domain-containing protein [Sorangium sp. So ce726]|uniref:biotin carboxylase N-terminal domain-containing protein n=1 Tax=Sorangium sp. So ce726 TaxID=3133319 RepID=UPI003F5EB678